MELSKKLNLTLTRLLLIGYIVFNVSVMIIITQDVVGESFTTAKTASVSIASSSSSVSFKTDLNDFLVLQPKLVEVTVKDSDEPVFEGEKPKKEYTYGKVTDFATALPAATFNTQSTKTDSVVHFFFQLQNLLQSQVKGKSLYLQVVKADKFVAMNNQLVFANGLIIDLNDLTNAGYDVDANEERMLSRLQPNSKVGKINDLPLH